MNPIRPSEMPITTGPTNTPGEPEIRLHTKAGSEVRLVGKRAIVDFDWFEENNACIECEVDIDASRDAGWAMLIWGCCECAGGTAPLSTTSES